MNFSNNYSFFYKKNGLLELKTAFLPPLSQTVGYPTLLTYSLIPYNTGRCSMPFCLLFDRVYDKALKKALPRIKGVRRVRRVGRDKGCAESSCERHRNSVSISRVNFLLTINEVLFGGERE